MIRNISYSKAAFGDLDAMVQKAQLRLEEVDYDTMIGTGLSGSLVIPYLARRLGKHWAIMRKPEENSHSDHSFEGEIGDRWLFVDDFMATGSTAQRVIDQVKDAVFRGGGKTELVGAYLYTYNTFDRPCLLRDAGIRV